MQSILQKVAGVGPDPVQPGNLQGRVAVVVGGTLGIGYEVSRTLAAAGARVVLVGRTADHGVEALASIRKETPGAEVSFRACDLGSLREVRDVFGSLARDLERLDFLVLSGGINAEQYAEDADGIDRHFGVNYLGQYYACNQLWPLLRRTARTPGALAPRVVFESSEVHRMAPSDVQFASLQEINNPHMDPTRLYGRSKLALILFAKYGLALKVIRNNKDRIFAVSVHPGTVNTRMQDQWKGAYPGITGTLISWLSKAAGRSPEQGSYSALWALTAPEVEEKDQNGWYFSDPGMPGNESSQASDPELGEALWKLSEQLVREKLGSDALVDWNAP